MLLNYKNHTDLSTSEASFKTPTFICIWKPSEMNVTKRKEIKLPLLSLYLSNTFVKNFHLHNRNHNCIMVTYYTLYNTTHLFMEPHSKHTNISPLHIYVWEDKITGSLEIVKISYLLQFYYWKYAVSCALDRLISTGHLHIHESAIARLSFSHVNLIS